MTVKTIINLFVKSIADFVCVLITLGQNKLNYIGYWVPFPIFNLFKKQGREI